MSLWYDKNGKSYAGSGLSSWVKFYAEYLTDKLKKEFVSTNAKHYAGQEGRHTADDVDFDGTETVKSAIQKEVALRESADAAEAEVRANKDNNLQDQILEEIASRRAAELAETSMREKADEDLLSNLSDEIVNRNAADNELSGKIDELDVKILARNNTDEYTPADDYNPATKKYVDEMSWNAPGFFEYKGLLDLSNVDCQRDDPDDNYFKDSVEDLNILSAASFDNLPNPVPSSSKYLYWVKLKANNGPGPYEIFARLLDDGSSGAEGDGCLTNRTQTLYVYNGHIFRRNRSSRYNNEYQNVEYWEEWIRTSSNVSHATSEVWGTVRVGGIAANNSYAVMTKTATSVSDFNSINYTYHGQYSVSFNGNASGAPQGLDSGTTYYGVLTTENYSNTNTASSNYGVYQRLSIPILNRTYERYVYDGAERYGDWTCITEAIKPLTVDNWKAVQKIVRSGMARQVFNIGDQLVCQRNGQDLVWDIIGIDHDTPSDSQYTHSMTLQLHDCIRPASAACGICGRQALFYAEEELPAGTYNFTLTANVDTANGGGKTYSFTLTQAVPAGGQIVFDWDGGQAADALIKTYSSYSSTAEIESVSVTEGANGTDLSEIGQYNNAWYIHYGSNNYINSAARQYLNSSGGANEWWMPKTNLERTYTRLTSCPGFLNGIDSDFLEVLGAVNKSVILNTVAEGGVTEVFADKLFLLSLSEVYGSVDTTEGATYEYYEKYSDLESPSAVVDSNRIKTCNGNAAGWWLRSCTVSSGSLMSDIDNTGHGNNHQASHGYADFAPACCIV